MSKSAEILQRSLMTSTRAGRKRIDELGWDIHRLNCKVNELRNNVLNDENCLKNIKVIENSGVVNIFEGIVNSNVLGIGKAEIQWRDSNTIISLLFGAHDSIFKSQGEDLELLKEPYVYRCTFCINGKKNIEFDNNKKNNYQDTMNDSEDCAWKRGEKFSQFFTVDMRDSQWCSIDDFSGGVVGCVRKVISTYNKREKKGIDMQKFEEMLIEIQGRNKSRRNLVEV